MAKPMQPDPAQVLTTLRGSWSGSALALDRVAREVLEPMLLLFYPPHPAANDEQMLDQSVMAIRQYAEDLCGFSDEQLRKGWREVRRTHKTRAWPLISVILDACGSSGAANANRDPARYHEATDDEKALQVRAYGSVYMNRVRPCDVEHHRRQAQDREAGIKGGYNPFAGKRAA